MYTHIYNIRPLYTQKYASACPPTPSTLMHICIIIPIPYVQMQTRVVNQRGLSRAKM